MDDLTGLGPAVEPPLDVWQGTLASALSSTAAPAELAALVPPAEDVAAGWPQPDGEGDGDTADLDGPATLEDAEELAWEDPAGTDPPGQELDGNDWLDEAGSDEGWA